MARFAKIVDSGPVNWKRLKRDKVYLVSVRGGGFKRAVWAGTHFLDGPRLDEYLPRTMVDIIVECIEKE